jgi:malonyl-CoA decarboxylase
VGVGMGEYLIHRTVERLQKELPSLETFCTLSPIPGFRQWLESDVARHDWISATDCHILAEILNCTPERSVQMLLEKLQNLDDHTALTSLPGVREVMLRWTAHYLFHEKHRRKPLDRVARFHISNGAVMDRLHWTADMSPKGWRNSFGIMVTYRYDLMQLELNQMNFESNNLIPMGDKFSKHVITKPESVFE